MPALQGEPSGNEPPDHLVEPGQAESKETSTRRSPSWSYATLITSATAVIALAISILTYVQLNSRPAAQLELPSQIRIAQGPEAWLYLQPTFTVLAKANPTIVVENVRLELRRAGGDTKPSPTFYWDESGNWTYSGTAHDLTWNYTADPSPLVISQDTPQQPTILFNSGPWTFSPGHWTGQVTATQQGQSDLIRNFCLDVSSSNTAQMEAAGQLAFLSFRNDVKGSGPSGCYSTP